MNHESRARAGQPWRAVAMWVVAVAGLLSGLAATAHIEAAQVSTTGGYLNWGIKESFRSYIVGPIAKGSASPQGGATVNGDGSYRFPLASGTYDATTGTASFSFGGSVKFSGHSGQLDMVVSNIRVQLSGGTGTVIADITSKSLESGTTVPYIGVTVGTLSGAAAVAGTNVVNWSGIQTTLAASGAQAFAGFYTAGQALDPLTISAQLAASSTPTATSTARATSTATATATATGTATPTATAAPTSQFVGPAPRPSSTGLLVTSPGAAQPVSSLTAALASSGCSVETLALLQQGSWRVMIAGAPPAANLGFPATLEGATPFFVRCV